MNKYLYNYTICDRFNEDIFNRQFAALEAHIPNIIKKELLHDVDDSKFQYYSIDGKDLRVCNSFDINAVLIDSDIDLVPFFK